MGEPDGVWVGLTSQEARALLAVVESGGVPMTSAGASAADKIRRALLLTGSDPHIEVRVFCAAEEARFLERLREGGGGFSSSC